MAILSTSTFGISNVFYGNLQEKETAAILQHTDQLPQNLDRVHNLVRSFDRSHIQIFLFFLLFPSFSIVCLLSVFCSNFDTPLEVQDVH